MDPEEAVDQLKHLEEDQISWHVEEEMHQVAFAFEDRQAAFPVAVA